MVRVRVRQHVNPLSEKYQQPLPPPNWEQIYEQPARSLFLDIGCARGTFLQKMAALHPERNFLGLEIREPLVIAANEQRDRLGLRNLHYLFCHANVSLVPLLASLPADVLETVAIQFPDPWFKKRHAKRRVVQPELVEAIARYLIPSGCIFLQSDVKGICEEMRDRFGQHPRFRGADLPPWLTENPFPVPSERELATLARGEPVYRVLFGTWNLELGSDRSGFEEKHPE